MCIACNHALQCAPVCICPALQCRLDPNCGQCGANGTCATCFSDMNWYGFLNGGRGGCLDMENATMAVVAYLEQPCGSGYYASKLANGTTECREVRTV